MSILYVCHAGDFVGLGHLSRALVAAKAFTVELGADVQLLVAGNLDHFDSFLGIPHRVVGFDRDLSVIIWEICSYKPIEVILFDLHPRLIPDDFELNLERLRALPCRLIAIDGLIRFRSMLDLIFLPTFLFVPPSDLPDGAPIVYGWDCFLLNVEVRPSRWQNGPRVLALTGGSDVSGLGERWPSLLDKELLPNTELHWVTGPFANMARMPKAPRIQIVNHIAPAGLGPLMSTSNYAVTVFGVSFFELLYSGIPTVVFAVQENKDQSLLHEVRRLGLALVADDVTEATILLSKLMNDENLARELSSRSRSVFTNHGALRLCSEVAGFL